MEKNKRIIVFGATGAVGAYTVIDLINNGYSVIAVGARKSDNGFFAQYDVPYFSLDISDAASFEKLPRENVYAAINLAGAMPASMKEYNPQLYVDTILTGTLNILNYCISSKVEKIIFAQSISDAIHLYGTKNPIPADIEMKFPINNDHSVYSICKNASVNLIEHYYVKYGLKRYILRFPNIYLYHPNKYYYVDCQKKWHAYRYLIELAKSGSPIEIWGDPSVVRDMVYVKDCTQIILKAIESNVDGGVYNVGTGIGTSLKEQIEGIVSVFSDKENKSKITYRPEMPDSPEYIMDISKTRSELGYEPEYDYISYLKDMKNEMELERFSLLWGNGE